MKNIFRKEKRESDNKVAYFQYSQRVSFVFAVTFNDKNKVNYIESMSKVEFADHSNYIDGLESNITENEFNEALYKTLEFASKNNLSVVVSDVKSV